LSNTHKSVVRNQGYTFGAVVHVERHNERKNENYSNLEVVKERFSQNIHFKKCDCTYLGVFDKMVKNGEINTRGLKLNNEGTKPESSIIAEMVFDVNTEFFEEQYKIHGYTSAYDFAKAFYAEAYNMAVKEVGDEKYILSAVMHADERNKGLSEALGHDSYHYHLHVTYIPVVQKEIKWTKRAKPELVGKVKEVINQVNHSKKWESEKVMGEDGKEKLIYSYSKLQDRYHDHMKASGFKGFERGEKGSTVEHLSVLDFKAKVRQEELLEKENKLKLANMELEDIQSDLDNTRAKNSNLVHEQEGLQAKRDQLERELVPIMELRKLKTKTKEIKIPSKPMFGSNAKMPYEDLLKLKEMADAYIANEEQIKLIRKRHAIITKKEKAIATKEQELDNREVSLAEKEDALASADRIKAERDQFKSTLDQQTEEMKKLVTYTRTLMEKLKISYEAITKIVQATGLLKYKSDDFGEYTIESLTPKQSVMLDALAAYGAKLADENKFNQQAEGMRRYTNLDEAIRKEMKVLNPEIFPEEIQKPRVSHGWGR